MNRITALVNQFETIYNGEPWYGNSIAKILEDITEDNAFWESTEGAHSIAQLVWHIIYWRQSLIKKLEKDLEYKASMKSEANWRTNEDLKPLGWKKLRSQFEESQQKIVTLLAKQDDSFLEKPYQKAVTMHDLIKGIIQHDIYHLGQIAYVKSILPLNKKRL
jgi:uncharacterized damage-inducible protein DinB